MKKQHFLYLSAFFALITFVGHSIGFLSNRALEELPAAATYELMKNTFVHFPLRTSRDIATLMLGLNLCLSVFLLMSGLIFIVSGKKANLTWTSHDNAIVFFNSGGLLLAGLISAFCFFPFPAICLALAALFGFTSIFRKY